MGYDVIIAGASFAGLAVAAQLPGKRVLLVDRKPIGAGQTSACGTLVSTLKALGLEDAILQVHDRLVVHTPGRSFVYPMTEPFCTFDYPVLCRLLWDHGNAQFIQAAVLGLNGDQVQTSDGSFRGGIVVDASGWRAVLASKVSPDLVRRDRLSFGLETTARCQGDGLHFWYDPTRLLPMGVTWAFPIGGLTRIGMGSYRGDTVLSPGLDRFLADLDLQRNGRHGGYFPHARRDPVVGSLFLVGDAAGQCLGLTGEGIRPALFFGSRLGQMLRALVDGEMSLAEARESYRYLVGVRVPGYDLLCLAQRILTRLPVATLQCLMAFVSLPPVLRRVLAMYLGAFRLGAPRGPAGRRIAPSLDAGVRARWN